MKPAPLALLLVLALCGATAAQEAGVLTLTEALERAAQHNPDYRMAQNELELSGVGRREAIGAFLPSLNLSAGTSLSIDRRLVATDFFGNPIENPVTEWLTNSGSSQSLSAGLTLFEGGRRFHELAAQGAQAAVREATVATRLRTLRSGVVNAYHQALRQQALRAVEEDLLAGRQVDLEMTRRMFELAGATRVEVLAAELNVQLQEQQIQQVQALLDQAILSLRTVMADPEMGEFTLAHELPEPADPSGLNEDAMVARALDGNPAVQEQMARVDMSRAQARAARGSRWPTISLNFGAYQSNAGQDRTALFDFFPDQGRYVSTGLSLSLPLFSRFQTQAQVATAEVAAENARETLRSARLQIEESVRSSLIGLRTAYQSYQISLRSREISEERLRLAREQFRLGSRTFTELQRDIDDAAAAERDLINRLFGFLEARVSLEELVGELGLEG